MEISIFPFRGPAPNLCQVFVGSSSALAALGPPGDFRDPLNLENLIVCYF